ncbi:hypothetical protein GCM10027295_05290 [Pseudaeromonas pectinilytica]
MIEALWVMTYFKISLPTRNWDIAFFLSDYLFLGLPLRHQQLLVGEQTAGDLNCQVIYIPPRINTC